MGTYCTSTSLQTLLVDVTLTGAGTTLTANLIDKCIDKSEQIINGYIGKRYDLGSVYFQTSSSIPPLVRSLGEDIAEGLYYMRSSRGGKESIQRGTDLVKDAKETLKMLQEYDISLSDTAGSLVPEGANSDYQVDCSTSDYHDTFDLDTGSSWAIDNDRLEDIESYRS